MSTDSQASAETDSESKRSRGPAVPTINLEKALALMRKIWASEGRNAAPVSAIVTHWGYKAKSSGGLQAIASLKRFGLLEELGSGEQRSLKLSPLAFDILKAESADPLALPALHKKAALFPKFHQQIWQKYNGELPSEKTMTAHLVFDLHFSDETAKDFLKEFTDTIKFAKLVATDTMGDTREGSEPPAPNANATLPPPHPMVATQLQTPLVKTSNVILEKTNLTREYRVPLDDENDAEIRFFGAEFGLPQIEALSDFVNYIKRGLQRKAGVLPKLGPKTPAPEEQEI